MSDGISDIEDSWRDSNKKKADFLENLLECDEKDVDFILSVYDMAIDMNRNKELTDKQLRKIREFLSRKKWIFMEEDK